MSSSSSNNNNGNDTNVVKLAIYDLSRGMARSLSSQFLGPQYSVEAIPHTGVVVFGQEYFYGGGIQSEDPLQFRASTGMRPVQIVELGRTAASRTEFESWCRRQASPGGKYDANSYDLLTRNCNDFANDAALRGLGMSRGVPQWVLDVPRRFLSSPMGQLVRPVLENMQLTGNIGGAHPIAESGNSQTSAAATNNHNSNNNSINPWAGIPSSSTGGKPKQATTTTNGNGKNRNQGHSSTATNTARSARNNSITKKGTPILDSFAKPLLSTDVGTVKLCVSKLLPTLQEDDEDRKILEDAASQLQQQQKNLDAALSDGLYRILYRCFETETQITFALFLLRIVVLKSSPPVGAAASSSSDDGSPSEKCMSWILRQLSKKKGGEDSPLSGPAPRSAAWLTAANAFGTPAASATIPSSSPSLEQFLDAAVRDISEVSQPKKEIRQAACSFLYNVALEKGGDGMNDDDGDLTDLLVSLLCSSLEGVDTEPDPTCRLRRLAIIGRILKPAKQGCGIRTSAKGLVKELGFTEQLEHVSNASGTGDDAEKCRKLATELLQLLAS